MDLPVLYFQACDGLNECEQVLGSQGSIQALCVDKVNGAIIAGTQEYIRSVQILTIRILCDAMIS